MSRSARYAALIAGGLAVALAGAAPSAFAASMTRTLHLHGGMYTRKAMASAKVTEVSKDDYRVQITAEGLPNPAMLHHVMPVRHAYLAWVIDGMAKHGSVMAMGVIPLTWHKATSTWTANRVLMVQHVTRIYVTADKSAMQHMPTMPEVTVLDSAMMHGTM